MNLTPSPQSPQCVTENEIAHCVLNSAFRIHTALGPGLLESVYEVVISNDLLRAGFAVQRQMAIPIRFEGLQFDEGFRADMIINRRVFLEIKSVSSLLPVHGKQVLPYLRLSGLKLGLLINFGEASLKNGIKRIVNGLPESTSADFANSADLA